MNKYYDNLATHLYSIHYAIMSYLYRFYFILRIKINDLYIHFLVITHCTTTYSDTVDHYYWQMIYILFMYNWHHHRHQTFKLKIAHIRLGVFIRLVKTDITFISSKYHSHSWIQHDKNASYGKLP